MMFTHANNAKDYLVRTCCKWCVIGVAIVLVSGCTHLKMADATKDYLKALQNANLNYLFDYDQVLFTTYNDNAIGGHDESGDAFFAEWVCRDFNKSELLADLSAKGLIAKPPSCFVMANKPEGKLLEIHVKTKTRFTEKTAALIYRDYATGQVFSTDELVMIQLHTMANFIQGDYATRLLFANRPPEGSEEYAKWEAKLKALCDDHDGMVACG